MIYVEKYTSGRAIFQCDIEIKLGRVATALSPHCSFLIVQTRDGYADFKKNTRLLLVGEVCEANEIDIRHLLLCKALDRYVELK